MIKLAALLAAASLLHAAELRLGVVGTDTSHVTAFAKILNDPNSPDYLPGGRIVAAYKGGSKDIESSASRVDKYADELRTKWKVDFYSDINTLCKKVDAVLLTSVDGRVHLEQVKPIIAAHKPVFIDKPLASTLADAREIARLAKAAKVPWFSASSLRYGELGTTMKFSDALGVTTWGPGPTEPHHELELSWYAIHPVELLYTLMGPGCEQVSRTTGKDEDVVVGRWKRRPHRNRPHLAPLRALMARISTAPKASRRARPRPRKAIARCWLRSSSSSKRANRRFRTRRPSRFSRSWTRPNAARQQAALRSSYASRFMPQLLEGKTALIMGIANKWSLAYAIAQAFSREGASLVLTYLDEHQKSAIENLGKDLNVAKLLPCNVTKEDELAALTESLRGSPLGCCRP